MGGDIEVNIPLSELAASGDAASGFAFSFSQLSLKMNSSRLNFTIAFFVTTGSTANRRDEKVPAGFFVPPLLLGCFPSFDRLTILTRELNVVVILRRGIVSIADIELRCVHQQPNRRFPFVSK
jgi:hypothetical protein